MCLNSRGRVRFLRSALRRPGCRNSRLPRLKLPYVPDAAFAGAADKLNGWIRYGYPLSPFTFGRPPLISHPGPGQVDDGIYAIYAAFINLATAYIPHIGG